MGNEVGNIIKQIRSNKHMTLKDLSRKSGLSTSFLSMVERGVTSPALLSLKKIADALEEDISIFFIGQQPQAHNCFCRSYDNNIRNISGFFVYKSLLGQPLSKCTLDPMEVILMPGQQRKDVIEITHSGEEFTYVLEGVLSFFLKGTEHVLNPGDCYHGFGSDSHNFVNLTNKIVRVLYIVSPPLSNEDYRNIEFQKKSQSNGAKEI